MATKVTDPALLAQLNGSAPAPAAGGPVKVTDPATLAILNGAGAADSANWERNILLPREVNKTTGESRLAMPGIVQGAIDAFMLPGDVYAGKVDPMSDEGIARGLGFATTFGPGALGMGRIRAPIPKYAKNLGRALKDDAINPARIGAELGTLGPDAMLMDLGPNLQAQAGALAGLPGAGQRIIRGAVETRAGAAAKSGRVAGDVAATIGTGPDLDLLKQQVLTAQSQAAKPLYDAVRDIQLPVEGNFKFVLQTPMGKQAFRDAAKMAANDGVQVDGLTVGIVDYAKRALDDIAQSAARKGNNNEARQARDLANILKAEADKVVPDYKKAREAFAGPAAVLDAMDEGFNAFGKDTTPAQLQRSLTEMTPSERLAFLPGAQAWVESQMGNAVNDPAALRNMFRKGWNEQKLRIILGDDVADDLLKRIDRELTYGKTTNAVVGNSETARRAAAMGEVAPETARLGSVGLTGIILSAFNKARVVLSGVKQPKVNSKMAEALTSTAATLDPTILAEIARSMKPPSMAASGANIGARAIGSGASNRAVQQAPWNPLLPKLSM